MGKEINLRKLGIPAAIVTPSEMIISPNASLGTPKGSYIIPFMIIEISSSPEKLTESAPKKWNQTL